MSWYESMKKSFRKDNKVRPSLEDGLKQNTEQANIPELEEEMNQKVKKQNKSKLLERNSGRCKTEGRREVRDDNSEMESEGHAEVIYKCKDPHIRSRPIRRKTLAQSNKTQDLSQNQNLEFENRITDTKSCGRRKHNEDTESEVSRLRNIQTPPIQGEESYMKNDTEIVTMDELNEHKNLQLIKNQKLAFDNRITVFGRRRDSGCEHDDSEVSQQSKSKSASEDKISNVESDPSVMLEDLDENQEPDQDPELESENQITERKECGRRNQVSDSDAILQLRNSQITYHDQQYANTTEEPPAHPVLQTEESEIGINPFEEDDDEDPDSDSDVSSRFSLSTHISHASMNHGTQDHPTVEIYDFEIDTNHNQDYGQHGKDNVSGTCSGISIHTINSSEDQECKSKLPPEYPVVEIYEFETDKSHDKRKQNGQYIEDNYSEVSSQFGRHAEISPETQEIDDFEKINPNKKQAKQNEDNNSEVSSNLRGNDRIFPEVEEFMSDELPDHPTVGLDENSDVDEEVKSEETSDTESDNIEEPQKSECQETESLSPSQVKVNHNSKTINNNLVVQREKSKGRRLVSESETENCSSMVTEESLQNESEPEVVAIPSVHPEEDKAVEKAVDKDTDLPQKESRYEKVTSTDRWVKNTVMWSAIVYSDTKLDMGAAESDTEIFDLNANETTRLLKPTRKYSTFMGPFEALIYEAICDADFDDYREIKSKRRRSRSKSANSNKKENSIKDKRRLKSSGLRSNSETPTTTAPEENEKSSRLGFASRSIRWIRRKLGWKRKSDVDTEIGSSDENQEPETLEKVPSQRRLTVLAYLDHGAGRKINISTESNETDQK